MKKFVIIYRHSGKIESRIVEALTRDYAMGCVCGFIYSCEEAQSNIDIDNTNSYLVSI